MILISQRKENAGKFKRAVAGLKGNHLVLGVWCFFFKCNCVSQLQTLFIAGEPLFL